MRKFVAREWAELISNPITLRDQDQKVFKHSDLPVVEDALSVTLRLKLHSHTSNWATIFHKGTGDLNRTPGLLLSADNSILNAYFTGNWDSNAGITGLSNGLSLNKWYHLSYTLSDYEKRLDIYIDGEWVGFYGIQSVKTQRVIFNDGPLYIGRAFSWGGFNGEISDIHYFNWRLSAEEVKGDFLLQRRPIVYGSKVAFIHVSTGKYLSTKGVRYNDHHKQKMIICNDQKIDLNNDVWTTIDGYDTELVSRGSNVKYNTAIGFRHNATGEKLHSHLMVYHGTTLKSNHQQVTLYSDGNADDNWIIRCYSPCASYDDSYHLLNGDIISLFHVNTDKPALYSHLVLLDDGTQEVSCFGNGNEENHKWRIELIE